MLCFLLFSTGDFTCFGTDLKILTNENALKIGVMGDLEWNNVSTKIGLSRTFQRKVMQVQTLGHFIGCSLAQVATY